MGRGNERDDSRGGIGQGGPQDGPIGAADDDRQRQDGADAGASGCMADGADGQGSQRHPGGSSRDTDSRH
jgi:hypothetical protein